MYKFQKQLSHQISANLTTPSISKETVANPHRAILRQAQKNLHGLKPTQILELQRTIGNQAVQRLLQRQSFPAQGLVQRYIESPANREEALKNHQEDRHIVKKVVEDGLKAEDDTILKNTANWVKYQKEGRKINVVAYTQTHDSDTLVGKGNKDKQIAYFGLGPIYPENAPKADAGPDPSNYPNVTIKEKSFEGLLIYGPPVELGFVKPAKNPQLVEEILKHEMQHNADRSKEFPLKNDFDKPRISGKAAMENAWGIYQTEYQAYSLQNKKDKPEEGPRPVESFRKYDNKEFMSGSDLGSWAQKEGLPLVKGAEKYSWTKRQYKIFFHIYRNKSIYPDVSKMWDAEQSHQNNPEERKFQKAVTSYRKQESNNSLNSPRIEDFYRALKNIPGTPLNQPVGTAAQQLYATFLSDEAPPETKLTPKEREIVARSALLKSKFDDGISIKEWMEGSILSQNMADFATEYYNLDKVTIFKEYGKLVYDTFISEGASKRLLENDIEFLKNQKWFKKKFSNQEFLQKWLKGEDFSQSETPIQDSQTVKDKFWELMDNVKAADYITENVVTDYLKGLQSLERKYARESFLNPPNERQLILDRNYIKEFVRSSEFSDALGF